MGGTHARLSPSSASRWCLCPGSVREEATYPKNERGGDAAERGTAAHELAEKALTDRMPCESYRGHMFNGYKADEWMIFSAHSLVKLYHQRLEWMKSTNPSMVDSLLMYPERKVNPGAMMTPPRGDLKGTADLTIVADTWVEIADLKTGRGLVEAEDNLQALLYAIGVLEDMPDDVRARMEVVLITIVQPNVYHKDGPVRTWSLSIPTLQLWVDYFNTATAATDDPLAPLVPSEKACKWCAHKGQCSALHEEVMSALPGVEPLADATTQIDQVMAMTADDPKKLTDDQINSILDAKDLILGFLAGVEKQATEMCLEGRGSKLNYKVVKSRGTRVWKNKDDVELYAQADPIISSIMTKVVLKTPKQSLDGLIKQQVGADTIRLVEGMVTTSISKKLVPATDSRPAIANGVEGVFAPIK